MTSISIVGVVFGIQFISSTTLEMNNEDIGLGRRTGGSVCKLERVSLGSSCYLAVLYVSLELAFYIRKIFK